MAVHRTEAMRSDRPRSHRFGQALAAGQLAGLGLVWLCSLPIMTLSAGLAAFVTTAPAGLGGLRRRGLSRLKT